VVVTGSSGVLGGAIAQACTAEGWTVRGIDMLPGRFTTTVADIRDRRAVHELLAGVDAVVHVAALHAPHVGTRSDADFWSVNVEATALLIAEATGSGVSRAVYTSSTSVYGDALVPFDRTVWVDESLPTEPRDVYDETKLAAEALVESGAVPAVVLRIARCFAEPLRQLAEHRVHRGVSIGDAAAAHVLALQSTLSSGSFNVAGPLLFEPDDVSDLFLDAPAVIRLRAPEVARAFAERDWELPRSLDRVYDSRQAANALGYHPEEGVVELFGRAEFRSARRLVGLAELTERREPPRPGCESPT
jgi:nucleoside-diphosphate-sugar epimerase